MPLGAPARIPIEADDMNGNTNDHSIPGIAAGQGSWPATFAGPGP